MKKRLSELKQLQTPKEIKDALFADRINYGYSYAELAKKYKVCTKTAGNIINGRLKGNTFAVFDPAPVVRRKELNPLERTIEVKMDAQSVVEMALALVNFKLEQELERMRMNDPRILSQISMKDLTHFFSEIAPYVLEKVDSRRNSSKETRTPSLLKMNHMFNSEFNRPDA